MRNLLPILQKLKSRFSKERRFVLANYPERHRSLQNRVKNKEKCRWWLKIWFFRGWWAFLAFFAHQVIRLASHISFWDIRKWDLRWFHVQYTFQRIRKADWSLNRGQKRCRPYSGASFENTQKTSILHVEDRDVSAENWCFGGEGFGENLWRWFGGNHLDCQQVLIVE